MSKLATPTFGFRVALQLNFVCLNVSQNYMIDYNNVFFLLFV